MLSRQFGTSTQESLLTVERDSAMVLNQPTWFGTAEEPLFGWLSYPQESLVKGGVVLALPVGFEARGARKAMRALASALAQSGYAALRFDYRGTGDSSGDFGSTLANPGWLDDVTSAVEFFRECGVRSVSAVGMRIGATLVARAATGNQLGLSAMVLWDPCESGRGFLRELRALETLRHEEIQERHDGSMETAEFLLSADMVESIRSLKLSESAPTKCAERTLVVVREKRPLSSSLRDQFDTAGVEFKTTDEQEALIGVHPFYSQVPRDTISLIVNWLDESGDEPSARPQWSVRTEASLAAADGGPRIVERAIRVGPRGLFAVTSEPQGSVTGPWIVMLSGVHEDHTGPSRLWVEIPRRWASLGLRCLRIDLSGTGESSRFAEDPPMRGNDPVWIRDVNSIGPSLAPTDQSNFVYIGYCSGGFLALEGAFGSGAKGVCTINLPSATDYSHAIWRLENRAAGLTTVTSTFLRRLISKYDVIGEFLWLSLSWLLPKRWSTNVMADVMSRGTQVLAIVGPADSSPYRNVPFLRRFSNSLTRAVRPYSFTLVPTLDHDMSFATGRDDSVRQLENFVESRFAPNRPAPRRDVGEDHGDDDPIE